MKRLFLKVSLTLAFAACAAVGVPATAQQPPKKEDAQLKCSRGLFHLIEGMTVRRMDFSGDEHVADNLIRRKMLLKEGEIFTVSLLQKSAARINKLGLFEKFTEDDVSWCLDEKTEEVDFVFEFTERPSTRKKFWK
jgi:outer membrane protein assembly factor BamA